MTNPKQTEEPEDLEIEISTPRGAEWVKIRKAQEVVIINSEINKEIAELVLELAEKREAEEQIKLSE